MKTPIVLATVVFGLIITTVATKLFIFGILAVVIMAAGIAKDLQTSNS